YVRRGGRDAVSAGSVGIIMLQIQTFDAKAGGNVIYKALTHPLPAEAISRLYAGLKAPVALYDPGGIAAAPLAPYPTHAGSVFVHDISVVGQLRGGLPARPLTQLPSSPARTVLIAAFDAQKIAARIASLVPPGAKVVTLDEVRLPADLLSVPNRYLDKL